MKMSDLKTADGVPFTEIDGDVYEPSEGGVRAGRVCRITRSGWADPARERITATVCLPDNYQIEAMPDAWYADRAAAYRKHIELVQAAANKAVAAAIAAMQEGGAK